MDQHFRYALFTKHYRDPIDRLGPIVRGLGFDAVELPVRDGYPVTRDALDALPAAVALLASHGVATVSVTPDFRDGPDERLIAAAGDAGVPLVRLCVAVPPGARFLTFADDFRRSLDRLLPALERHGVALALQNHTGRQFNGAMHLYHVVGGFDPARVCAALDPAHCALCGEPFDVAMDIIETHVRMVNLKNGYMERFDEGGPGGPARWRERWVGGRDGLADWANVAAELERRGWCGPLCLSGQYSDAARTPELAADDLAYAKRLFERGVEQRPA